MIVRAELGMPSHEVYARVLPQLVPGTYVSYIACYNSARLVARDRVERVGDAGTGSLRPSFPALLDGEVLTDEDVKAYLKRAAVSH